MGRSLGKILWEIVVGKSYGKLLRENLAGKSCGKFLRENLAGKLFVVKIIWNRVKGSQPIRYSSGKSCGKILWEILAGNWDKEEGKRLFKKGSGWWKFSIL